MATRAASVKADQYPAKLNGSWGEFKPPSSDTVLYLSTTVKLSGNPVEFARSLAINELVPVREVLPIKEMKFQELLQRDIDDHRVAHHMVPYLLGLTGNKASKSRFFPPILAIFLPNDVLSNKEITQVEDPHVSSLDGSNWNITESRDFFRFRRQVDDADKLSVSTSFAILEWDPNKAKLVVIDGQHRLMAMLAIHRTRHRRWPIHSNSVERLYHDSVTNQLNRVPDLDKLELEMPVTILLLPELSGKRTGELYPAARKIFVDVNQGAKSPTPSRLILLSDNDLTNIATRQLLEMIRSEDKDPSGAPNEVELLPAIQYDASSEEDETTFPRETRILTLESLKEMSNYLCFRAERLRRDVRVKKEKDSPKFTEFAKELQFEEAIGRTIPYEENGVLFSVPLSQLEINTVPSGAVETLIDPYLKRVGTQLSVLLRNVNPYRAHLRALHELSQDATRKLFGDIDGELVKEAIFHGSGAAFTIERIKNEYAGVKTPPKAKSSWTRLAEAESQFKRILVSSLFTKSGEDEVTTLFTQLTKQLYSRACLYGMVMTNALLLNRIEKCLKGRLNPECLNSICITFAESVNQYMDPDEESKSGAPRTAVLMKDPRKSDNIEKKVDPFNLLPKVGTDNWVEYRCLWLELLLNDEKQLGQSIMKALKPMRGSTRPDFKKDLDKDFNNLKREARQHIFTFLRDEEARGIKRLDRGLDAKQITKKAASLALDKLFRGYQEWFNWTEKDFGKYFATKDGRGQWKVNAT
jgi:hypothetical protein